ncbi:hypothetical protein ABZ368_11270 [Streptomyces sp. NPDC005908]|uniref:hypothetical protein n=1 Tax=Streptomyces sp. NPDC005908 TaxID=3157084 RepID=UPI00340D2345
MNAASVAGFAELEPGRVFTRAATAIRLQVVRGPVEAVGDQVLLLARQDDCSRGKIWERVDRWWCQNVDVRRGRGNDAVS